MAKNLATPFIRDEKATPNYTEKNPPPETPLTVISLVDTFNL